MILVNGMRCPTLQDFEVAAGIKRNHMGWVRCHAKLEWPGGGAGCVNRKQHGEDGHVWARFGHEPADPPEVS